MKRTSQTKSIRYIRQKGTMRLSAGATIHVNGELLGELSSPAKQPRKGTIRIVNGKVVKTEEVIAEDSPTADTASTLDELRAGRNTYQEQMSSDYNW